MKLSVLVAATSCIATGVLSALLLISTKDRDEIYADLLDKELLHLDFRGEIINIAKMVNGTDSDLAKMLYQALDGDLYYRKRKRK